MYLFFREKIQQKSFCFSKSPQLATTQFTILTNSQTTEKIPNSTIPKKNREFTLLFFFEIIFLFYILNTRSVLTSTKNAKKKPLRKDGVRPWRQLHEKQHRHLLQRRRHRLANLHLCQDLQPEKLPEPMQLDTVGGTIVFSRVFL